MTVEDRPMGNRSVRSVAEVRDAWWDDYLLDHGDDDWVSGALAPLVAAASTTPLRMLYPFTSMNSLFFSRCSAYPFTYDCPWIWFNNQGHYITFGPPVEEPVLLLETDDLHAAATAAVAALPHAWQHVWVGDASQEPDR